MSAIVVMNLHIAYPLLKLLTHHSDTAEAQYWEKRAICLCYE